MTSKEAFETLKRYEAELSITKQTEVAYDVVISARYEISKLVERDTPMKPKAAWKNEEDESVVGYRCLNCNGSLGAKLDDRPMFPNFCRHCGQRLDWEK